MRIRHILGTTLLLTALQLCGCGSNTAGLLRQNLDNGHALLIFPVIKSDATVKTITNAPGMPDAKAAGQADRPVDNLAANRANNRATNLTDSVEEGVIAGETVVWSRLEPNRQPQASDLPLIADLLPLGDKYAAITLRPGTYYVRYLGSRVPAQKREPDGENGFASRLGEVRVNKTPARRYVLERVWEPPEYELINGRRVRVWDGYYETRVRAVTQTSYLEAVYDVLSAAPEIMADEQQPGGSVKMPAQTPRQPTGQVAGQATGQTAGHNSGETAAANPALLIGTITVEPGDVLLIPGVQATFGFADGSCRFKGHEAQPGYAELASKSGYSAYFGTSKASERESLFHISVYQCPVESLSVTLIDADINDLRLWADEKALPPGTLERVRKGEFKPGAVFAQEHQVRAFNYVESRFFSRDITYTGNTHIFTGRPAEADEAEVAD